ncbi:MAG: Yip1 family protein [Thermoanaerobaculia bacterium]
MDLVARAKAILLNPKQEWPVIEKETTTTAELYTGYIVPLAAIGPIARAIGLSALGVNLGPLGSWRVSPGNAVGSAVVGFVCTLAGVWVLAWIIDALAPKFGGQSSSSQALKVAAYSATAAWLAGIFAIVPALGLLGLLGLYSLYLLYLGLPVLMKSPVERSGTYTVVVVIAACVIFVVIGLVASRLFWGGRPGLQF